MEQKDVLKPFDDQQIMERLEKMGSEKLKAVFKQTLNLGYFHIIQLIIENTAIKKDIKFLNSLSEEIREMREIVSLVEKYCSRATP